MSWLQIDSVSKTFTVDQHEHAAVRDISLGVAQGEVLCLLGPSGCGKTTLLRLVAGLERPDAGQISLGGRSLQGVAAHRRGFGLMFQDFALFPHQTVGQNIAFGLRMQKLSADEISDRVAEMLALVDLAGFADRAVTQLSGGEQQRVALARALAPGPGLLMLDEPLGALDRRLRERLMLALHQILQRVGVTALYVTHDQTEAFAVADRVAVLNAGRVEQVAAPQTVFDRPASAFVAQFLGFENVFSARWQAEGLLKTEFGLLKPAFEPPKGYQPNQAATVLVKPTALRHATPPTADSPAGANVLSGKLVQRSFRGRYTQVWFSVGEVRLMFEVEAMPGWSLGEELRLELDSAGVLVLGGGR